MTVHNLIEEIVRNCLKEIIQKEKRLAALNEHLQSDIMAIALNRLPPRYVSTLKGEMFAKTQLRPQVESDVYREIAYAIDKVLHHSRKEDFKKDDD